MQATNTRTFQSRLPKRYHQDFLKKFEGKDICTIQNYPKMLPSSWSLSGRTSWLSTLPAGSPLQGIYASLPSNLDSELKQFGLKIGKFKPGNSIMYECNRLFVYQFLMELHGFPIVSERRTSSAMFALRLLRQHERFIVRVQGQSDRTITTLMSPPEGTPRKLLKYPMVEKIALVQVHENQKELIELLKDQGYFVDVRKRVVILRVTYQQHDYSPRNVREDRALSVCNQEISILSPGRPRKA